LKSLDCSFAGPQFYIPHVSANGLARRMGHLPPVRSIGPNPAPSKLPPFALEEGKIATRIQLGPMPTMLSEIVGQMLDGRDIVIAGPSAPGTDALASARELGAQLLVVQSEADHGTIDQIFALPELTILMISSDGRQGRLVSFAQKAVSLDRASIAALAAPSAGHA
jgi:hypothetical protein